jgi:hypothetical protein
LYKCPCGDQPVTIAIARQQETYLDGAFWCSGTLALIGSDGRSLFVFNPYSFAELTSKLGNFDTYIQCMATKADSSCVAPSDPVFDQQQVPLLSVWQRCLTNHAEMVWDQGAHALFNKTFRDQQKMISIPEIRDRFGVSGCLLQAKASGFDNDVCLVDYFLKGASRSDVFEYSNITESSPVSSKIHACLTFSGPSANSNPSIAAPFRACLEGYANSSGCEIAPFMWSGELILIYFQFSMLLLICCMTGRSQNRVPVASMHLLKISDDEKRKQFAQGEIAVLKDRVLKVLDEIERDYTGNEISVSLWSAESDLLHSTADCILMVSTHFTASRRTPLPRVSRRPPDTRTL